MSCLDYHSIEENRVEELVPKLEHGSHRRLNCCLYLPCFGRFICCRLSTPQACITRMTELGYQPTPCVSHHGIKSRPSHPLSAASSANFHIQSALTCLKPSNLSASEGPLHLLFRRQHSIFHASKYRAIRLSALHDRRDIGQRDASTDSEHNADQRTV
jgi:hypothetical protein